MGVSEEHDQTVDADTPATSGRQTVLESNATVYKHKDPLGEQQKHSRVDERLVDPLRLVVALFLLPELDPISCTASVHLRAPHTCSSNRRRYSKGSFNSVYAL